MSKLSRDKGARYERDTAHFMNRLGLFASNFHRELRETQQGNLGDVKDTMGTWPLDIQCKHKKQLHVGKALAEAEEASMKLTGGEIRMPIAFCKYHGGGELVAMRPATFGILISALDEVLRSNLQYSDESDIAGLPKFILAEILEELAG